MDSEGCRNSIDRAPLWFPSMKKVSGSKICPVLPRPKQISVTFCTAEEAEYPERENGNPLGGRGRGCEMSPPSNPQRWGQMAKCTQEGHSPLA